jgi:hypothetical protein
MIATLEFTAEVQDSSYGMLSSSERSSILGRTTTTFYTGWFYTTLAPNGSGLLDERRKSLQ